MVLFSGNLLLDLLAVFTAILVVIYSYYKWILQYWKRHNIPYIEPSVPFGNLESPFKRTISIGEVTAKLYRDALAKGLKQYCGIYFMAMPTFLTLDLDLVKNILTKDFSHFTDRNFYTNEKDDPLTCHLFSLPGAKWRNLRIKLTPTFTSGKMKAMFQTLVDCGEVLEDYLEEHIKTNEPVDIKDVLGKFSTDIIGSCAFGLQCNSFKDPNSLFRVYGKKVLQSTKFEEMRDFFSMTFPNLARALHLRTIDKDVSDFFIKVVKDTVAYREKNNVTRRDFLQLLINIKNGKEDQEDGNKGDGNSLTMMDLTAQCFLFFLAGFETSSTTMTFTLYNLATHPEIQDKVREEINTVLKRHNNKITYDSINELTYMKQVVDETLRMYPAVPFLSRMCVKDYKIPGEDIIIEKGVSVMIPVLGIQHDQQYYKNPEKFDPERFNEENKKKRHPYAHLPFGEGPRNCIGERFGVMQTKVGLTSLLRKFKITLNRRTEVPLKMSITSFIPTVDEGIWFDLKKI